MATETPEPGARFRGFAKIRRTHVPQAVEATVADGGRIRVRFDEPVKAAAPGQALVVYDAAGVVLGGGFIAAFDA